QVEEAQRPAGARVVLQALDGLVVDAGDRDVGTEAVHRQDQQGEQDLVAEVLDPEDVADAREHRASSSAAWSAPDQRFANWLPWIGGRPENGSGRSSTVPPAALTASCADADAACTRTVTDRVS